MEKMISRTDLLKNVQRNVEDWVAGMIHAFIEQYKNEITFQYYDIIATETMIDCMRCAFEMACEVDRLHRNEAIRVVSRVTWKRITNAADKMEHEVAFNDWSDIVKEVYEVVSGYTLAMCC